MKVREMLEEREEQILSPYASLSKNSKGRDFDEPQCDIRPVYQRDRDRIVHCKAFRRLKDKTQVYLIPEGDHYRTRLTHTLEVSQIARTIAKAIGANEEQARLFLDAAREEMAKVKSSLEESIHQHEIVLLSTKQFQIVSTELIELQNSFLKRFL